MATKKQIKDLEDEVVRLNKEVDDLRMKLVGANRTIDDFLYKNQDLHNLNNHLADERDRLARSDNIHREECISLISAIAVLGRNEISRNTTEIWHSCQPRTQQAISVNEKSEPDYSFYKGN